MGRIVAIDYGRKRAGIAVTDPLKIIATNLITVPSHNIINFLKKYTVNEEVECFVVGLAKKNDNTESESMEFIRPFTIKLKQNFPEIPVTLYDERYTSKLAVRAMVEGGMKKSARRNKATIDSVSATILLQDYLNKISIS